ncbi:hypothetical protein DV096_12520 [Bradymonadaceae bacterium TMQ3]|uniref:L,D-TPase catalytic domain-containing protein n=1 Tax=Lujinxingia sediminis TaxID=2480984 RepID=A0ABY0CQV4_9DELT|nr:L,D-transpeptidase family protein [Lujinxingia sediminis]RDV37924.1 hypothetical protein DV096_12520 [Bradymonadaceae bacterium TMQ3]RVU42748.1 hypothetical protein EA187_14635 [Lujinxingia sediminis]TXC75298.1 L,D-transpeptidase family protein [Bradymonadales bacterium TMQ1]
MKRVDILGRWQKRLAVASCAWVLASCGTEGSEAPGPLPAPVEAVRQLVESRVGELAPVLEEAAREKALRGAVEALVANEAARPFAARVQSGLRYSTVYQREYVDGERWPFLTEEGGLNEVGLAVLEEVRKAPLHGIDPTLFGVERIEKLQARIAALSPDEPAGEESAFKLQPQEVESLVVAVSAFAETHGGLEGPVVERTLIRGGTGLERVQEYVRERGRAFAERSALRAELELYVADAALRYAREMRHANLNRLGWRELRDAGGSTELILGRMQHTLEALNKAGGADDVQEVFRGLEPDHPQYRALFEATQRYREWVAEGGWPEVRPVSLREGTRSPRVGVLRERLRREGYLSPVEPDEEVVEPGDEVEEASAELVARADVLDPDGEVARSDAAGADEVPAEEVVPEVDAAGADEVPAEEVVPEVDPDVVDAALIEAMRLYRQTHQFQERGEPGAGVWRSLNVSAERRLAQMELTLGRWRESHMDGDEDFVFVNIPDFHAEVFVEGERQMRFRVVVGNNKRVCDRDTGRWVYPNATPVQWAPMEHMILNPSWYVPPRLVRESLAPKAANNPNYYEENGYEVLQLGSGEAVRQKPGPDNALGVAKFIFPNEQNIYLHDTPQKHYFDYPVRGFSSGCVRVHQPVELARFLAEYQGREELNIDELIDSGRTRKIDFERQLPVFIEYYTVWIDEAGHANFLADIYRDDARRSSEDPEAFDDCSARLAPKEVDVEGSDEQPAGVSSDLGP